jgi:hypothetical protein
MNPYSLPVIGVPGASDNSTVNGSSSTLAFLTQPYQFNSSGELPATTTINVGQNVQISGPQGSIIVVDPTTQKTVISILGEDGYILYANPNTGINQMVEGTLPDGTTGLVASVAGVDVLSVFT